jgi:hypothetical protein
MKNQVISEAISKEAGKLVCRHQIYASELARCLQRREVRTGLVQTKHVKAPQYWSADKGFNPYHVRAHSKAIAYAVTKALDTYTYQPRPAVEYSVPKPGGGQRPVSVFQVADNAISRLTFDRLLDKNSRHFSAHAYAYRRDLTIHDAVLHVASDLQHKSRIFIAEFDYSKFFDSINHEHIERILRDRRFFITSRESLIIKAFLQAPTLPLTQYDAASKEKRSEGIPPGTSISLFLANVAAYPLDRRLEDLGVGFARYADDTLIWSGNYSKICEAVDVLEEVGFEMGVDLNFDKSDGISILCPDSVPAEFKHKSSVCFIGYEISPENISIRPLSLRRIKEKLAYLVYSNLLQAVKKGHIVAGRVSGNIDDDYVVMLHQIRRYLYGELSESQLLKYMARQTPLMRYHGLMSFYPVVDDERRLKEIDGWLIGSVHRALRLRARLLKTAGVTALPRPHGRSKHQLLALRQRVAGGFLKDLRFPSIARVSRLMRRAARTYGASTVANPQSAKYYSA